MLFLATIPPDSEAACKAWEKDLDCHLDAEDWERFNTLIHKGSLNVCMQGNAYKIRTRWHKVLLHKICPTATDCCWCCLADEGTFLHIWRTCPNLVPFWTNVYDIAAQVTGMTVDCTSSQYLLHHSSLSVRTLLINIAQLCVSVRWMNTSSPSLKTFLHLCEQAGRDGGADLDSPG